MIFGMKNKKYDEVQSRREFFKKAAKSSLPILGAIVLANIPLASKSSNINVESSCYCYGCVGGCNDSCYAYCTGECRYTCVGDCNRSCLKSCYGGCYGSAYY